MKRNFILGSVLVLTLLATSCGKKEVKILSPNIKGDLSGCYKITDTVCEVTKDDEGKPSITINIQRTEESVPYTTETIGVFATNDTKALTLGGFGYEGYDEKGDLSLDISGEDNIYFMDQQVSILKLQSGESAKLMISFDGDVPEGIIVTSQLKFVSTGEITLDGAIGKYGIKNCSMSFNFEDNKIIGQYQYLTSPAGSYLYLMGNVASFEYKPGDFSANIAIAEDNGKGTLSGKFKGQLKLVRDSKISPYYYVLVGTFRNSHLQDFRYDLKSAPLNEIKYGNILKNGYAASMNPSFAFEDFNDYGFRSYAQEANYVSKGTYNDDMSVDEFIRQYKRFFKTYVAALKKAQNGDPTVALEIMQLASEYNDFQQKAANLKGQMSPAQLNEISKMAQEILQIEK